MKLKGCEYEQRIISGTASARQNPEIAAHIAQCADCQETLRVASWMQNFAVVSQSVSLPKPGFIMWKAQLREKQTAAKRATQPIIWIQAITVILVATAGAWGLIKNQDQISSIFGALTGSLGIIAVPMFIAVALTAAIFLWLTYIWREHSNKK